MSSATIEPFKFIPKITSGVRGEYEVYLSGTVISFNNEPVTFQLAEDLAYIFKFEDIPNKEQKMTFEQSQDKKTLSILLTNFNSPLGDGNASPIEMGLLRGKKLYLEYRVRALNRTANKEIYYSWYLDAKN